jgi:hypothetical protein
MLPCLHIASLSFVAQNVNTSMKIGMVPANGGVAMSKVP